MTRGNDCGPLYGSFQIPEKCRIDLPSYYIFLLPNQHHLPPGCSVLPGSLEAEILQTPFIFLFLSMIPAFIFFNLNILFQFMHFMFKFLLFIFSF